MKSNCDKILQQLLVAWHTQSDGALEGYATLRSLTEKLNPATLIPKLLPFWESRRPITTAGTSSEVVRTGAGLERTVTYLSEIPSPLTRIAQRFTLFLSTLEDLHLVMRAADRLSARDYLVLLELWEPTTAQLAFPLVCECVSQPNALAAWE